MIIKGMPNFRWIENLKRRWNVRKASQVFLILLAFACTGITVMLIKRPLLHWLTDEEHHSGLATVLYYILVLPLYNIVLLGYGFLFGQIAFFWGFEKRMMERFFSLFKRHK
jgi:hypothetical protein